MGTDTRNGLDEKTVQWDHVRSLGGARSAAFSGDEQHKLTSLLNLFPMPGPLNGHFGEDWTAEKRRYVGSKVVVRSAALLQLVTRLGAFSALRSAMKYDLCEPGHFTHDSPRAPRRLQSQLS